MRVRVLHVLKRFHPEFTGEGVFCERISPVLDMLAPEVEHELLVTMTPRPDEPYAGPSALRKVHYVCAHDGLRHWRQEALQVWWFIRNIHRYKVLHIRTHSDRFFVTYLLARTLGKRLIISATLDDSVPGLLKTYRPLLRPAISRLLRVFHAFVAISTRLHHENESVLPAGRSHLIPIGILIPPTVADGREAKRTALGLSADAFVMVFVGGLCQRKDPLFLVEHLPAILAIQPRAVLMIVGPVLEADYHARMLARVRDLGLEGHVRFEGWVPSAAPYLDVADVFTFTSRLEGFGTVVIEAMAHALPVVVRRLPGVNDDFVTHNETGFFFEHEDDFVTIIEELLADPGLARRVGAAARASVIGRFGMRTVAKQYLKVYGIPTDKTEVIEASLPPDLLARVEALPAAAPYAGNVRTAATGFERPVVLTMIDAEEEFDWSQPFSRKNRDVRTMAYQDSAQRVFERHGVVPVYLIDDPVATTPESIGPLRDLLMDGRCDIGTQLHPWVSPPFLEEVNEWNSFSCNLPLALQYEKLARLTEVITTNLDHVPQVFRAGRYGIGPRTGDLLKSFGYKVDVSVSPYRDYSDLGGACFYGLPTAPYWLDEARTLLEIPVSCGLIGLLRHWHQLVPSTFSPRATRWHVPGLMARTGLMERIKLSPEGSTLNDACRLVRSLAMTGQTVFMVTYHSPSLCPGHTPYVRNERDLRTFLDWLDDFYTFFAEDIGGTPVGWNDVYDAAVSHASGRAASGRDQTASEEARTRKAG